MTSVSTAQSPSQGAWSRSTPPGGVPRASLQKLDACLSLAPGCPAVRLRHGTRGQCPCPVVRLVPHEPCGLLYCWT